MRTTIVWPGENPSDAFYGPGAVRTPFVLRGICFAWRFRRRPVGEDLSARVYASLGHGSRLSLAAEALAGTSATTTTARTAANRRPMGATLRARPGSRHPRLVQGRGEQLDALLER